MRQVAPSRYQLNLCKSHDLDLAQNMNMGSSSAVLAAQQEVPTMSHLQNIASRQRKSIVRDAVFAALVAVAAILSISMVGQVVQASSIIAHR
jgi:hypothetical protein